MTMVRRILSRRVRTSTKFLAEGAPTESLFLGDEAIKTLPTETLTRFAANFPNLQNEHLETAEGQFIVKGHKQKQFVARHLKNQKLSITLSKTNHRELSLSMPR